MSSLPGLTLGAFLRWNYDLVVENTNDANPSLGITEALGRSTGRRTLTPEQFSELVALFAHYRDCVVQRRMEFDEETASWRDFASYSFDFIDDAEYQKGLRLIERYAPTTTIR